MRITEAFVFLTVIVASVSASPHPKKAKKPKPPPQPTFNTAPSCGNGATPYCCIDSNCDPYVDGHSQVSFCPTGTTVCCTQNSNSADGNIQICAGGGVDITINL